MAYDLVVGKSKLVKDAPDIVSSIVFDELKTIASLSKKVDCVFLNKISHFFSDTTFTLIEIQAAINALNPLMLQTLTEAEKHMLHKLLAVLGYANTKQQNLFGIAD